MLFNAALITSERGRSVLSIVREWVVLLLLLMLLLRFLIEHVLVLILQGVKVAIQRLSVVIVDLSGSF